MYVNTPVYVAGFDLGVLPSAFRYAASFGVGAVHAVGGDAARSILWLGVGGT